MAVKNAFYAQSGGVTAVINSTACFLDQAKIRSGKSMPGAMASSAP